MKQIIKINETQLKQIVKESVNKTVEILRESENVDLENNIRKIWLVFDRLKNEINSDDGNYSIHAVNLRKAMNGDENAKSNLFFWIKSATGFEDYMLDTVFDAWCKKNGVLREGADDNFDSVEATRIGKHKKRRGVKTKGSTENRDFLRQQTAKGNPIIKYKRNPKEWLDNFMNQSDDENQLSETKLNRIVNESVKRVLYELNWKTYANAAKKRAMQGDPKDTVKDLDAAANKELEKLYSIPIDNPYYNYKSSPKLKTTTYHTFSKTPYMAKQEITFPEHEHPMFQDYYKSVTNNDEEFPLHDVDINLYDSPTDPIDRKSRKDLTNYIQGKAKYVKGKGWQ